MPLEIASLRHPAPRSEANLFGEGGETGRFVDVPSRVVVLSCSLRWSSTSVRARCRLLKEKIYVAVGVGNVSVSHHRVTEVRISSSEGVSSLRSRNFSPTCAKLSVWKD